MNEQKISWKRSDLKWRGKQAFKKNYWSAVLVSLVLAIVMATGGSGAATGSAGNAASPDLRCLQRIVLGTDINGVTSYVSHVFRSPLAVLFCASECQCRGSCGSDRNPFSSFFCGKCSGGRRKRFFTFENLYSVPGPGKLLSVFRSGNYGNIVKTMFLRDLYLVLWTLLFIIPGVVKSYEYKMIPYLLAEYPDMSTKEVFAKSREMMDGQKMDTFILDLSFIPWSVLSAITAGIVGLFYVSPYKDATYAELYDTLAAGMPGNGQQVYEDENSGIY